MKAQIIISLFAMALSLNNASASRSQELLNDLFNTTSKDKPLPEEIASFTKIGIMLTGVNAVNSFPFGSNQIEYVKNNGIKSIVVNFKTLQPDGTVGGGMIQQKKNISFSTDGLVKKIDTFNQWTKI